MTNSIKSGRAHMRTDAGMDALVKALRAFLGSPSNSDTVRMALVAMGHEKLGEARTSLLLSQGEKSPS